MMFKNFIVKDVLNVEQTKSVVAKANLTEGDIPYVTRTVSDNGYTGTCGNTDKINAGNCITIGAETGIAFYQPNDFVAGNKVYRLSHEGLGIKEYLFLASVLNMQTKNYSYSNARIPEKIRVEKILLPVIENPNPDHEYTVDDIDWQYMRDRITELERDRITELDAYLQATGLNDYELTEDDKKVLSQKVEFTDILIGELFNKVEAKCKKSDFDKRKDTSTEPNDEFYVPLINAKLGNNGIMFYGRPDDWNTQSMCIDVIQNGAVATGKVYVQSQATAVLWDAYLIKPTFDNVTEYNLLYLACCIEKLTKERFSYEKKATWDRIKECFIAIPIKSDGTPDFNYMERYIRAMEKVIIADAVKYKDKVIETTKKVIS